MAIHQRFGLWLARVALLMTRNRELADACSVLPLVPQQKFMILAEPADQSQSMLLSEGPWILWRPSDRQQKEIREAVAVDTV